MKIMYNVTGADRKKLVAAIAQELNAASRYLGMPTTNYEVGGYTVDRDGTVAGADDLLLVAMLQEKHGFTAVNVEYDGGTQDGDATEIASEQMVAEPAAITTQDNAHETMTVEYPLDGFTLEKIDMLRKLTAAKSELFSLFTQPSSNPLL